MDRKQFLKGSVCGICACSAAGFLPVDEVSAAGQGKAEEWRLPFVQRRYARLWEILATRLDEETLKQVLHELGSYCSSLSDDWIKKHNGDFDAFCKSMKQTVSGDDVTYDRERDVIVMASDTRTNCFCPMNSETTPIVVCNCSLGWQQHTWETFLQRKVKVELKEAVLRGGKRCVFEISAQDPAAGRLVG